MCTEARGDVFYNKEATNPNQSLPNLTQGSPN